MCSFSWSTNAGTATGQANSIVSGQTGQVATDWSKFTPGATYSYTISASDGTDFSQASGGPCEFQVDNRAPHTEYLVLRVMIHILTQRVSLHQTRGPFIQINGGRLDADAIAAVPVADGPYRAVQYATTRSTLPGFATRPR